MEKTSAILISATQFLGRKEGDPGRVTKLLKGERKGVSGKPSVERKEQLIFESFDDFLRPDLDSGCSVACHQLCNVVHLCSVYAQCRFQATSLRLMRSKLHSSTARTSRERGLMRLIASTSVVLLGSYWPWALQTCMRPREVAFCVVSFLCLL